MAAAWHGLMVAVAATDAARGGGGNSSGGRQRQRRQQREWGAGAQRKSTYVFFTNSFPKQLPTQAPFRPDS